MNKVVVYINWEGHSYEQSSWINDKAETLKLLGNPKTLYVSPYDVGLLVANQPIKSTDKPEMFETRHGQSDPSCTEESLAEEFVEGKKYEFGEIFDCEDLGKWEKFNNFTEMEIKHKDWFA